MYLLDSSIFCTCYYNNSYLLVTTDFYSSSVMTSQNGHYRVQFKILQVKLKIGNTLE